MIYNAWIGTYIYKSEGSQEALWMNQKNMKNSQKIQHFVDFVSKYSLNPTVID